jgi:hypothetical protein
MPNSKRIKLDHSDLGVIRKMFLCNQKNAIFESIINKAIMGPSTQQFFFSSLLPQNVSIIRSSSGGRQWCTVASGLLDCIFLVA